MAYRRLSKLEQEANSFPQDVTRQAALYKVNYKLFSKVFLGISHT